MKIFRSSFIVSIIALIIAYLYAGWDGLMITAILAVLEISLSMDNAIVNARILERMSHAWRKICHALSFRKRGSVCQGPTVIFCTMRIPLSLHLVACFF